MKIAISATSPNLNDPIDLHFGRAKFFLIVNTDTNETIAHNNAASVNAAQGAGIQSAETIAKLGAQVVLTGSVGPKAFRALQAAEIQVALLEEVCPAADALARYQNNELPVLNQPNSQGNFA